MAKINGSSFQRLIGIWKTTGQVSMNGGTANLDGVDSYEFILEGNYILHKANVAMANEKSETFEVIAFENETGKARMQYFNAKGESGTMTAVLNENNFEIDGDGIKFRGRINESNTEIIGKWFLQAEDKNWSEFINLKLKKQS